MSYVLAQMFFPYFQGMMENYCNFLCWPENECHKKMFGEGLSWELTSESGSFSHYILKSNSDALEMMDKEQQRLWCSFAVVGWCYHHCSVSPVDDF